ncbi:MAG: hypothetical protein OQK25_03020 [Gammaproteobacteria bacterium]|nr:hypothetical protein [Gammaproteobacteria bacterium]
MSRYVIAAERLTSDSHFIGKDCSTVVMLLGRVRVAQPVLNANTLWRPMNRV